MYQVGNEEFEAMKKVVQSQNYFRYQGPGVETVTSRCEKEWQQYLKSHFCLLNTSGTNALVIGMAAFGIGPGDEVIIPSYTFVATASAVMQVGAIPVIANIDETLTLDLKEVKEKITKRTKAVVAVHMDGLICDLDGLAEICCDNEILLVEDAAQACGGHYKGKPVGTLGAFGGFSFNMDKVISCGEGGLLTIASDRFTKEAKRAFVIHDTPSQYGHTMKEQLKEEAGFFGLSTRMNEINAAMLNEQLKRLPKIVETLRKRKKKLISLAQEKELNVMLGHDDEGDVGTHLHIKGDDPLQVVSWTKALIAKGIEAMPPHLRPAHACWQWMEAMSEKDYYVPGLNPFKLTEQKYRYDKAQFLPTIQILGQTLRIKVDGISSEEDFNKNLKVLFNEIKK